MSNNRGGTHQNPFVPQQLLVQVAEQLKVPLLQIAREAELGQLSGSADLRRMQTTADAAMRLIDHYTLGVRLALEGPDFEVEPVCVSSVLYDAGQQLSALAKNYHVKLELDVSGRYEPVLAHRQGLQAALVSLGASLIEALPALDSQQLTLQLATHRTRYGIVAGLYADTEQLTKQALARGRDLLGDSRQPLLGMTHTSGAGVFVADSLLQAMQLDLTVSRHRKLYGLATILQPTNQLQLV